MNHNMNLDVNGHNDNEDIALIWTKKKVSLCVGLEITNTRQILDQAGQLSGEGT